MSAVNYDAPITLGGGPGWVRDGRTPKITLQLDGLDILELNFPATENYRQGQFDKGLEIFRRNTEAITANSSILVGRLQAEYHAYRQRAYTFATILVRVLNETRRDNAHIKLAAAPDGIHGWTYDLSMKNNESMENNKGSVLSIYAPNHKPGIPFCTIANKQVCASPGVIDGRNPKVLEALRNSLFISVKQVIQTVLNEMPTHLNDQRTLMVPNISVVEGAPKIVRTNLLRRLRNLLMRRLG